MFAQLMGAIFLGIGLLLGVLSILMMVNRKDFGVAPETTAFGLGLATGFTVCGAILLILSGLAVG